jgi:hypothetical protein
VEDGVNPVAPETTETAGEEDLAQAQPVDGVESLGEVQLERQRGRFALEEALHHL